MWGEWHLGSDPEERSPVDFGFDEAVWCPRTADEVLWTMQSYFPDGSVTATPYAGKTQIPLEPEPIYSRKKGAKSKVISTYDAEFRAAFDRKITEWACDFMTRSKEAGKPFYTYTFRVTALYRAWEEPLAKEPTGVYKHDDGRPMLGRKLKDKSQRELDYLGLVAHKDGDVEVDPKLEHPAGKGSTS